MKKNAELRELYDWNQSALWLRRENRDGLERRADRVKHCMVMEQHRGGYLRKTC